MFNNSFILFVTGVGWGGGSVIIRTLQQVSQIDLNKHSPKMTKNETLTNQKFTW
jgi:hypothetical protein